MKFFSLYPDLQGLSSYVGDGTSHQALGVMAEAQERERRLKRRQPKKRSDEEKRLIERAKGILMSGAT